MTMFPAKMPGFLKRFFPNYVWDFYPNGQSSNEKVLYLTFDDGPVPEATEFVLDALKKFNAKATFFCIGENVKKHPQIFKKVISQGHSFGNHTQHHLEGWKVSTEDYISDTLKAQEIIDSEIKNRQASVVNLFRPPYGRIKRKQGKQLESLGYKIIMWDVVAKDWLTSISEEDCLKNIINNATNGSIVVMHDSMKASKNLKFVLPKVLEHFSNKGYEFKAINPDRYRN